MVSIRRYLGFLKGYLGGAGSFVYLFLEVIDKMVWTKFSLFTYLGRYGKHWAGRQEDSRDAAAVKDTDQVQNCISGLATDLGMIRGF